MKQVLCFAAGALVGSAAAYIFLKEHFASKAQEEIDSVVQAFRGDQDEEERKVESKPPILETSSIDDMRESYQTKLRDYRSSFEAKSKEDEMKERAASIPRVISPSEVNFDEYDSMELIYYADGVLASPDDEIIDDIPDMVGDALKHFGEYEEDIVLVNNDRLKLCIEISRDTRNYSDVAGGTPLYKGGD